MIRKPTFVCANTKNIVSSHSVEQIDKMPPADQDQARNARQQYRAFWPIRRATQRYKPVFRTLPRYREVTVGTGPALASNSKKQHGGPIAMLSRKAPPLVFVLWELGLPFPANHNGYIKSRPSGY